jgi:hypothetical protein
MSLKDQAKQTADDAQLAKQRQYQAAENERIIAHRQKFEAVWGLHVDAHWSQISERHVPYRDKWTGHTEHRMTKRYEIHFICDDIELVFTTRGGEMTVTPTHVMHSCDRCSHVKPAKLNSWISQRGDDPSVNLLCAVGDAFNNQFVCDVCTARPCPTCGRTN